MPHSTRPNSEKYEKILEALRTLLETKKISQISVSEIAQTAGIGKGSIYYYFSSNYKICTYFQVTLQYQLDYDMMV